eukprot:TRINITY_DN113053_c0_g1_i1.p2 TRINITY_DN113053_c0_g1~~TRINITY_DN113053_c0_g1_i1.p2  ORF type:complete len:198 (-),score=62.93 TRINITY_DN113053_c0_g1_i1:26-619(-)
MAYRPGMGLQKDAVERLRARKQAEAEGKSLLLPGQDDSEQANLLLGNGAVKVPRCGLCTRPLDDEAVDAGRNACGKCTGHATGRSGNAGKRQRSRSPPRKAILKRARSGSRDRAAARASKEAAEAGVGREERARLRGKLESIMQKKREDTEADKASKKVKKVKDAGKKKDKKSKKDKKKKKAQKKASDSSSSDSSSS